MSYKLTLFAMAMLAFAAAAQAQTFTTLYNFTGAADGGYPFSGPIVVNGRVYGTTPNGGADNDGVVYELNASGAESVIYSFTGQPNGSGPDGSVIMDGKGNYYGTTPYGGAHGDGTVYVITSSGTESVLYSFAGGTADGCYPQGGLLLHKGTLYGTTSNCGAHNEGVLFSVTTSGTERLLHSFAGGDSDGAYPYYAGLIVNAKTDLFYGVTEAGGSANDGVLYEMNKKGKVRVLWSFAGGTKDGCNAYGTPTFDKNYNLYGTTYACGASNYGTVWKVTQEGKKVKETILHSFAGAPNDGENPINGVGLDAKGDIYGATESGGANSDGAVYELSKNGKFTLLHSFDYSDGAYPYGLVFVEPNGDVYGTAHFGGTGSYGTVWAVKR